MEMQMKYSNLGHSILKLYAENKNIEISVSYNGTGHSSYKNHSVFDGDCRIFCGEKDITRSVVGVDNHYIFTFEDLVEVVEKVKKYNIEKT